MSKKWTSELDSIVLQGVFEECQISFGKAMCEKIAARVRAAGIEGFTECTPKAVENRLYSWKKKNVTAAAPAGDGTPAVPSTPKKPAARAKKDPATPKTPRAKKGAASAKKAGSEAKDEGKEAAKKRGSSSDEEGGAAKKVKHEDVDGEEDIELGGDADGGDDAAEEV